MRKGLIGLAFVSMGMIFSSAAFSAEMARYDHQRYQSKSNKPVSTAVKSGNVSSHKTNHQLNQQTRGQQTSYNNRYQHQQQTEDKAGHPVFIAFPDRK